MRVCTRSVLDDTIPGIKYDVNGVCNFCKIYDEMDKYYPIEKRDIQLKDLVEKIKKSGKGKKYDCIIGVSGGTDSMYTMLQVVKLGLRPLAVHLDNGWNSDIAVKNIKKGCEKLNVDLHPHNSNSKVQNNLKNKILVMINSTKNRNKKLHNKVIVIGSSSTVIEALMYNYEVIHIVENEELEIYSNLFWKNINLDFLSEGIIQYKSINKKRFLFKKNKEKINYI